MRFEFDPVKSQTNLSKHGIDFTQAQQLWDDPGLLQLQAKSDIEDRSLLLGKINNKHWSAIVTYRGDAIQIISVRRSRKREVERYES